MKTLKRLYKFLLVKHVVGFMRFCYLMLIPCVFSDLFTSIWFVFLAFLLTTQALAITKGWNDGRS